ncbi:hypothetical protein F5Y12DRAFT_716937 [Xylaria sp. FL1777]|nr:hypothetical protein F5Y12DRAFT_716937 [Xylaria sp. FL1777]
MSPNGESQRDLMRSVYSQVGLQPCETPYVEAHGTGAIAGDTNEISSIYEVFCEGKQRQNNLIVGSIKANIGHLKAVVGFAGLVKSINVLNSKLIPPQLNFIEPKSTLILDERNIKIATQLCPLPPGPCRASVNSFGYGGNSNWPATVLCPTHRRPHQFNMEVNEIDLGPLNCTHSSSGRRNQDSHLRLFIFSANTETSLKLYAHKLPAWMVKRNPSERRLADISYTPLTQRSLLPWRHAIVASDYYNLSDKLYIVQAAKAIPISRLAFIFKGQGAQWIGMGKELMHFPIFERSLSKSDQPLLEMGCEWNLSNELFTDEQSSRLNEAEVAQPARTALQIALIDLLSSLGIHPTYVVGHSSGEIAIGPNETYVVLDTAEDTLLLNREPRVLARLNELLNANVNIVWVALQDTDSPTVTSLRSMIQGASRVIRRENDGTTSLTFQVEDKVTVTSASDICQHLLKIIIAKSTSRTDLEEEPIKCATMTGVDRCTQDLEPLEIQVSTRAHGINFKDVFISLGQMPPSVTMVGEMSGIVTAVGRGMIHRYVAGDHVMGFFAKPFASNARVNGHLAHIMPKGMAFGIAATNPCIYTTAYHCLFEVARLKQGQSALITAAPGGVGQAAIQLAQYAGVNDIFVTLGSKSKKQLMMDTYGIPASHIFSSRMLDFKQGILRLTRGRGVDVVLNSLTGDMLTDAFDCVARLGTFCEIGKGDICKGNHLRLNPFDRSITFAAVDLVAVAQDRPETIYSHLNSIIKMFVKDAFQLIAARKHTGKIVLESPEQSTVKATLPKRTQLVLSKHAAYIIAGGLGDIGRRLATLLASRGAKHIVLLSRRAPEPELSKEIGLSTASFGCVVHSVKCDITEELDIFLCAAYCQKNHLLVKGIIHSAMVLRDRPFAKMTLEEFGAPLGPKVYGTMNLDKVFASPDLDFFIMLSSSATIIGNGTQANYAAANAFQDAFANAKADNVNETRYVALNLGAIEGSRSVSATSEAQSNRLKSISITMEELLLTVEYAMSPQARHDKLSHAIMGISRQGLTDVGDLSSLKNVIFSHLPAAQNEVAAGTTDSTDITHRIGSCSTVEEAQALVTEAVTAKCASFLGCDVEEISQSRPLSEIGFDSLVSIELKNWLLRTFDSPIQMAEISGASSVVALAIITMERSRLVNIKNKPDRMTDKADTDTVRSVKIKTRGLRDFKCCVSTPPPKLPLFSLKDYLNCYWQTVSVFTRNDAERESLARAIAEFRAPESVGARTYASLIERANDADVECWLADAQTNSVFLHFGHPIAPWNAFIHTHHDSPNPHSQAERAALLTGVAFRFLRGMERNEIKNDWLGSRPLCSYDWKWMFNAVRRPRAHCDEMKIYPDSTHIAVLRNGHVFRVPLQYEHVDVSLEQWTGIFQAIIDADMGEDCSAGILTTDFRDIWAANREKIIQISDSNLAYFQTIEEATFVVCLDRGERIAQGIAGDGFNRWFDKTTQFVVYADGRSAHISDHSMIDGTIPLRLTEFIHDAIMSHQPGGPSAQYPVALPEHFPLKTSFTVDDHIR